MPAAGADTIPLPTWALQQSGPEPGFRMARLKWRLRMFAKWWLTPHRPFQPLFVIATYRSGSNLLVSYLRQQPNVAMLSEVLSSRLPVGPDIDWLPPQQAIRHIRHCLQSQRAPIRGCKLMLHQLSDCGLSLDDLKREFPTAKYIVLYRQSIGEQFVSHQVAQVTNQYLVRPGERRRQAEIRVDADELRGYCDDIRRRYRDALASHGLESNAVLLSYEELTTDPVHWMQTQVCALLNVPFTGLQTKLVKQNTRPLAEQVTNYRDVASLLNSPLCRQQHHWPCQPAQRAA